MTEKQAYSWITSDFTPKIHHQFLLSGSFIWVFNWHEIPHLGFSLDGYYYSLSISGAQRSEAISKIWRIAEIKEIPLFFIQIQHSQISAKELDTLFLGNLLDGETCLRPIKNLLAPNFNGIQTLVDLILYLVQEQKIIAFYANAYKSHGPLSLQQYNKADVLQLINEKSIAYETRR